MQDRADIKPNIHHECIPNSQSRFQRRKQGELKENTVSLPHTLYLYPKSELKKRNSLT